MGDQLFFITIKLGTKACRFAQQARNDFVYRKQEVMSYMFSTGSTQKLEFPSALIFSREGHAEEFGYRAINQFEEIEGDNEDCVFFENVIESLYISEVC